MLTFLRYYSLLRGTLIVGWEIFRQVRIMISIYMTQMGTS